MGRPGQKVLIFEQGSFEGFEALALIKLGDLCLGLLV